MAESIVMTLILNKLTTVIENYVQTLCDCTGDHQHIIQELESIEAFLHAADSRDESDPTETVWVKQVREVAHEIEDVLDEYLFSSAHKEEEGCNSPFLKIKSWIRNCKANSQISSSLKGIIARIDKIYEGHKKYSSSQLVHRSTSTGVNNEWYDPRVDERLQEISPVGIEKQKQQLIEWLESTGLERRVIPVVGMGGLGKTTLVKEVYNYPKIKNSFTNHIWITVSESFKIEKLLLKDIMEQLKCPIPQGSEDMDSTTLKEKIKAFLLESKYLLVLDDIWSTDAWDAIIVAFPDNLKGSRVMITTRNTDIASTSSVQSGRYEIHLKPLSDQDSWALFSKTTFQDNCPPYLEETCSSILSKCDGLPLAIVAISGVLATKDPTKIVDWFIINSTSLSAVMQESSKLKRAEKILSLSYHDLPYYLKSCFLYLSIFPEHSEIELSRLIRLWVAEGFVTAMPGRTLEEEANNYLHQLLARNLIQVARKTSDGRIKMCQIHNFLREIIISKAKDQNIADIATKDGINSSRQVRRLSLHNTLLKRQQLKTDRRIRSLFMFGNLDQLSKSSMPVLFTGGLRLLTVLEMKGAPLDKFPDAVVKLYHLRYLSLRNTNVSEIPNSIQNLQHLETLDLKNTLVRRLPIQISNLKCIRHILVYQYVIEPYTSFGSKYGFQVPLEIGNLHFLQKLCFIEADQSTSGIMLSQLGKLQQLRRLGIIKLKTEDGKALCSSIAMLTSLRALSLMSKTDEEILDLQHLTSPPKFIQRLYLVGPLEYLPQWITSLRNLVKLSLKWSRLQKDPLQSLQDLPHLVHLELIQVYKGDILCFKTDTFQTLKHLIIDNFDTLESVIIERGAMPNLKKLIMLRCELLNNLPSGIESLTKLKFLEFFGMPDKLISTIRPDKEGADCWKVEHIPEVYSNNWIDNRWITYTLRRPDKATSFYEPTREQK